MLNLTRLDYGEDVRNKQKKTVFKKESQFAVLRAGIQLLHLLYAL